MSEEAWMVTAREAPEGLAVSRGLRHMEREGWALVRLGTRWFFCLSGKHGHVEPSNVIRFGHWATPRKALEEIGRRYG